MGGRSKRGRGRGDLHFEEERRLVEGVGSASFSSSPVLFLLFLLLLFSRVQYQAGVRELWSFIMVGLGGARRFAGVLSGSTARGEYPFRLLWG